MSGSSKRTKRSAATPGEALFRRYLETVSTVSVQDESEYSRPAPHVRTRPDFRVDWEGQVVFCEVKDLRARAPAPGGAHFFDPYKPIRKEIAEARKQFRGYENFPCVLVLYNVDDWEFRDRPWILFSAMLGDLGIRIPFDRNRGVSVAERAQNSFLANGRMVRPASRRPQNTTFSAIAVLTEFRIPDFAFNAEIERRLKRFRGPASGEDRAAAYGETWFELFAEGRRPVTRSVPRVAVFENPDARHSLPRAVFTGSYDARYGHNRATTKIERTYAGEGLCSVERERAANGELAQKLEQFRSALVANFNPTRIMLFGSHATGTADSESDVDLLVEFSGSGDLSEKALEIRRRINPDFPMDLLTCSSGQIERRRKLGDPFIREVLETGKTLYP